MISRQRRPRRQRLKRRPRISTWRTSILSTGSSAVGRGRFPVALVAVVALASSLALTFPPIARAARPGSTQQPAALDASSHAAPGPGPIASPGTNLLLNPRATVGDASQQGWDAVTIPGWHVQAGLPTVVAYATPGFPKTTATWPASRGRLFVGGAGGTAKLTQDVPIAPVAATPGAGTMRYNLQAWLGGTKTSDAELTVRFLSARGATVAAAAIGPVGRLTHPALRDRAATGAVPAGATHAEVTLTLATTLTDANGPNAPRTGYDYAAAGGLSLTVSQPVRQPAQLAPPKPDVPRYQHVFLFYFENSDYSQIIGNTRQAPDLNSLTKDGSLLAQFYAEEHPSDANYLAMAGGSAFGVPLDDPAEENPLYTISAPDIGDRIDQAHETWKAYLQSSNGPCDDTVHGYYWNDDQPMLYFKDVRGRPRYCARHVVPLEELGSDLATAATTPNFAWIAPDDCTDMEGCGIKAGDDFLKTELTAILRSPAWRTQRSLVIITFDEDAQDFQRPAQRVPTIILGSRGVRQGYVSRVRYTHYSLLRTIEAALGLGTLTGNDLYAQPVNDIFYPERSRSFAPSPAASATSAAPAAVTAARDTPTSYVAAPPGQPIAWVANFGSNSVTPVNLTTRKPGHPIPVGSEPRAVVATPDGKTVYVADSGTDTVTPIDVGTAKPGRPIVTGSAPWALAVTPDGRTLYVANSAAGTVTPVSTATGKPGRPIAVGKGPRAIVITPDGRTAYVLNWLSGTVTPISIATNCAGPPIPVGAFPLAAALGQGAKTLYVANFGADDVTPISVSTGKPGRPVPAGYAPDALAATSGGVYVVDGNSDRLTRLGEGAPEAIRVGYAPDAIAVGGSTAYVVNTIDGTVTPVNTRTGRAARPLSVGLYSYPTAITMTGQTAIVLDSYGGQVSLINTRTGHVYAPITVGAFPAAVAVTR